MPTTNNATGVYATLGYNFNDPNSDIKPLSANTLAHMNSMPAFITTWQAQDIANNTVNGYYKNPVANDATTIKTTANSIITIYNTANTVPGLETIYALAQSLNTTANTFIWHTNRLSGVVPFVGQDADYPYYDTAVPLGKTALYITNQTDGITNTSPILGSFTSILVGPQISANANLVFPYVATINNSITTTTTTDPNGNVTVTSTTNLTAGQITTIQTGLSTANTSLGTRMNHDFIYFTNLKNFVDNYNATKKFVNMGETESYLVNDFIGTDKLLSRINS